MGRRLSTIHRRLQARVYPHPLTLYTLPQDRDIHLHNSGSRMEARQGQCPLPVPLCHSRCALASRCHRLNWHRGNSLRHGQQTYPLALLCLWGAVVAGSTTTSNTIPAMMDILGTAGVVS